MTTGTGKRGPRGSGTVRERKPGYWEVRVPARNLADKPIQVSRYVHGTRRDAERKRRELLTEVDRGHHKQGSKTLADLLADWLRLVASQKSPATYASYEKCVRVHIVPALGNVSLGRLGAADLDRFYLDLRSRLGANSIGLVHKVLRRGLNQGVKWGWLVSNPALRASPPPHEDTSINPPSWDAIAELITATESYDPTMAMVIFVAALTGLRRGELCGLRWSDFDAGTVTVSRRVLALAGSDLQTHGIKTRSSIRRIALANQLLAALETHRRRMEDRAAAAGKTLAADAYVFSNLPACSVPLHPTIMSDRFAAARERVGMTCRLHDLRHFQATWLLGEGVDVKTVSGRLGHKNANLTLSTYAHFLPALDAVAAAHTERLVLNAPAEVVRPEPMELNRTNERG